MSEFNLGYYRCACGQEYFGDNPSGIEWSDGHKCKPQKIGDYDDE